MGGVPLTSEIDFGCLRRQQRRKIRVRFIVQRPKNLNGDFYIKHNRNVRECSGLSGEGGGRAGFPYKNMNMWQRNCRTLEALQ